jgi:hypothetical protein
LWSEAWQQSWLDRQVLIRKRVGQHRLTAIDTEQPFGQVHFAAVGAGLRWNFDSHAIHNDFPALDLLN